MSDLEYDKLDEESIARAAGYTPESLALRMNRVNSKKIKALEAKIKILEKDIEALEDISMQKSLENRRISADLQIAVEALKLYASEDQWCDKSGYPNKLREYFEGYRVAREALEKLRGGE